MRALVLASALWGTTVRALDITECGQLVRAGEVGELRRDLDCRRTVPFSLSDYGVILDHGGTVNLNGHTLRGDGNGAGVGCYVQNERPGMPLLGRRPCTVNGPGEITGFWAGLNGGGCTIVARAVVVRANQYGVVGPLACAIHLADVTVTDNLEDGVVAWDVYAQDVEASRNGRSGLIAHRRLDAANVRAIGNGDRGVEQRTAYDRHRARIRDSVVIDNLGEFDITFVGRFRLQRTVCGRAAKLRHRRIGGSTETEERLVRPIVCPGPWPARWTSATCRRAD